MWYLVEVVAPLFSAKELDVYQVATSMPLPLPGTVVGAIGAAMGRAGLCRGMECLEAARRQVRFARVATSGGLVKSFVVLRRLRKVLEEGKLPPSAEAFAEFSDAISREYVFTRSLLLLVEGDVEEEHLYLIDRLGDSESLVAVVNVAEVEPVACTERVNVVVKRNVARGGDYVLVKGLDERGSESWFAVPLKMEGRFYVAGAVEVAGPVRCVKLGDRVVAFPDGDEW
jgi:CRISPR-associated protein Cas5 subtype I-A